MPPKPRAITDAERRDILRRHAAGESRNSIVKATGRAAGTISKIVAEEGLSFERGPEVIAATTAKVADLAARRAQLALDLHSDAERLREQLWEPHEYFDWGGKDHDFGTHTTPEPSPADKRSIMSTVATAVDRSLKLEPVKDEDGNEAIGSLLGSLFDRLQADHGSG